MKYDEHEHVIAGYETYLRAWNASERTIGARVGLARSRLRAWGGVSGFTTTNVEAFLARDAKGQPRSKWTAATYFNHLNDFCRYLVASGELTEHPMEALKRAKPPKRRPRPLTEAEIARVLASAQGEVRDWIVLALLTGLRAFEIAKLRGEHFTDEGLEVIGKGDVEAVLPIHPEVATMAGRYPTSGYWFPSSDGHVDSAQISLRVGRLFASLGIDGSIHRCRHSYATRLLRAGANIRVVQRLMRHGSLETTAGYLAVMGDEEREAILLLTA